jgi:hypothetical protein
MVTESGSTLLLAAAATSAGGGSAAALYSELVIAQERLDACAAGQPTVQRPADRANEARRFSQITEAQRRIAMAQRTLAGPGSLDLWA